MTDFRISGITRKGKRFQSEIEADSKQSAQEKVKILEQKKGLRQTELEEKKTFIYKVKQNGSKPLTGEQQAYSKEELEQAFSNLGYEVVKVQKKLFDFKGSVPTDEVVSFIRLSADLLQQGLRFDEILRLIGEDVTNKRMKNTIKQIEKDLKDGKEGREVYGKHENVFGKFATYMLSVASTSGNMSQVFESTAKFLERDSEFKKNLRKSLLMPMITLVAVFGVVVAYVTYIFPKTASLFLKFDIELPPMTAGTLALADFLQIYWLPLTLAFAIPSAAFFIILQTKKGRRKFDQILLQIPVIGNLLHKTSIEIFARVFYTLYSGSGENVEVIRVAAEACRNSYMEHRIKTVALPMMLREGKGLVESLHATGVFPKTAISRFRLGSESGALRSNAKQLADYYESQTGYKMESVIATINVTISMFIMIVMVAITIISSETAVIKPNSPI